MVDTGDWLVSLGEWVRLVASHRLAGQPSFACRAGGFGLWRDDTVVVVLTRDGSGLSQHLASKLLRKSELRPPQLLFATRADQGSKAADDLLYEVSPVLGVPHFKILTYANSRHDIWGSS